MGTERVQITGLDDRLRNLTRRVGSQERRPQVSHAADLLGPGFGPTGREVDDWNDEEATFNGFFWCRDGSLNSPDPDHEWAGFVVSEDDHTYGIQVLWTPRAFDPIRQYTRRWSDPTGSGSMRSYTEWRGDSEWIDTGITGLNGCAITEQSYVSSGNIVHVAVKFDLGFDIAAHATGNITNADVAQMPLGTIPSRAPMAQALHGISTGPLLQFAVQPSGIVQITAVPPLVAIDSSTALSFGGSYVI